LTFGSHGEAAGDEARAAYAERGRTIHAMCPGMSPGRRARARLGAAPFLRKTIKLVSWGGGDGGEINRPVA
jgi:hypothetical protein